MRRVTSTCGVRPPDAWPSRSPASEHARRQLPRRIARSPLLGFRDQAALPAAYVALGLLRELLDCCEVVALITKYRSEVVPVSFADIELSARRAARRLHDALRLEPLVVAVEVEEVRHGVAFALRHLLAWKHGAHADATFDVHGLGV